MENITLGEISIAITFMVGFLGGVGFLYKSIKGFLEKLILEQFEPFNTNIDDLKKNVERVDMESCKNYLVRCLGDFEHGNKLSDVEQERFCNQLGQMFTISKSFVANSFDVFRESKIFQFIAIVESQIVDRSVSSTSEVDSMERFFRAINIIKRTRIQFTISNMYLCQYRSSIYINQISWAFKITKMIDFFKTINFHITPKFTN